jgi:hypothetical protein
MKHQRRIIHLEDLIGHLVTGKDGRPVGRIEEVRAERGTAGYEVTEYLLGTGALVERLSLARRLLGRRPRTYVARWDQVDVTAPERPRLRCSVEELEVRR